MSDDQDTMDEWAAALAEAEGTDGDDGVVPAELDELTEPTDNLTEDE